MAKGSVRKKGKKWYYRFYVEDASGNLVQKEYAGTESKSDTEKPHCGKIPTTAPNNGPNFPDFFIVSRNLLLVLCSIYSIIKYVINKNGNNFIVSINASSKISIINSTFLLDIFRSNY